jgi:multiple sugar transport system permease protein
MPDRAVQREPDRAGFSEAPRSRGQAEMSEVAQTPMVLRTAAPPVALGGRLGGVSDRWLAWWFIGPTILLLLAINIFPLIWTLYLSFTNFKANRANRGIDWVGIENYRRILSDSDIWAAMQVTAHFVFWSIFLQVVLGFGLALLLDKRFRGHGFWTTVILLPMMLSPAVVGTFWSFLFQPQIGLFNTIVGFFTGIDPSSFQMIGDVPLAPWAIVLVDTWMWTPYVMLICLAGLRSIPDYIYEAAEVDRASAWRQFWSITVPMVLPFLMLAVLFRAIENFKMFDMVNLLTSGGPGSTTEVASITLKREAFEKWRTGYSSAFAIILFVTVFGAANIYVKTLNALKNR